MEVVCDCVFVELVDFVFLCVEYFGEVVEVVDCEWDVGGEGFLYGFVVFLGFGDSDFFEVLFYLVGDVVEDYGVFGGVCFVLGGECFLGDIDCLIDVFGGFVFDFGEGFVVDGIDVFEVLVFYGFDEFVVDVVVVLWLIGGEGFGLIWSGVGE